MAGVTLGYLKYVLGFDSVAFRKGATEAEVRLNTMQKRMGKSFGLVSAGFKGLAAGLSIGLFVNGVRGALEYAGSLGEVAQQLGVTTTDLQKFRYAAGQVGVDQEKLEAGLSKLTVTLGNLAAGSAAPAKAFAAIGLSAKDLAGVDTGTALRLIADGLGKIPDRAERAAVEVALFGKAGAALDNLLAGGSRALNELARAAEELGMVLSPDQIARADEAADKFAAVQTVLKAKIAGVVADNANSIIALADGLGYLISKAGEAASRMTAFYRTLVIGQARWVAANPKMATTLFGNKGAAAMLRGGAEALRSNISDATPRAPEPVTRSTSTISDFKAGGGGGGGSRDHSAEDAERKRVEALRDAFAFDEELRQGAAAILRAQQDLSSDYVERTALSIQLLDLDKASYQSELAFKVASGELTDAKARQLLAAKDRVNGLERDKVLADEEAERREGYNELEQVNFDVAKQKLESELQLATTASEQRDIRLRLLDLDYRQEKARLEAVIADEKISYAAREEARRRLAALNSTRANDQQGVVNATRGPMEDYLASVPDSAAKMEEALQRVKVRGIDALSDGLTEVAMGTAKLGDVFRSVAQGIIADLIRIGIQKMIVNLIGSISGTPGIAGARAAGGPVSLGKSYLVGEKGPEIFTASRSGKIISNDDAKRLGGGGGNTFNFQIPPGMTPDQGRATGYQLGRAFQRQLAGSTNR